MSGKINHVLWHTKYYGVSGEEGKGIVIVDKGLEETDLSLKDYTTVKIPKSLHAPSELKTSVIVPIIF